MSVPLTRAERRRRTIARIGDALLVALIAAVVVAFAADEANRWETRLAERAARSGR